MVRVNRVIDRSAAESDDHMSTGDAGTATVSAGDLVRSIEFYKRVFGFHVQQDMRRSSRVSARLTGPNDIRLVVRAIDAGRPAVALPRLRFVVGDLEDARAVLWDAGVGVSRDSGQPDQIFRGPTGRSLYIRDPAGNEIELVEGHGAGCRRSLDGNCRINRWRRAMRRRRYSAAG
jgi:catechol 2,3-dioxygenase-like lactoylglutathione lyase family enzyme